MYKVLGDFNNCELNKPLQYFQDRETFLDCRGKIYMHPTVMLGFNITIFSQSHDRNDFGVVTNRDTHIGKNVFIGSNVVLFNTHIGDNAIIALGTVVRSRDIPADCMVEGNPARIVRRKYNGVWEKCDIPIEFKLGKYSFG